MNIGKLGVWALVNFMTAPDSAAFARRIESWGYGTLWVPEVTARDPLVTCSWLLANTDRSTSPLESRAFIPAIHLRRSMLNTLSRSNRADGFCWGWVCLTDRSWKGC